MINDDCLPGSSHYWKVPASSKRFLGTCRKCGLRAKWAGHLRKRIAVSKVLRVITPDGHGPVRVYRRMTTERFLKRHQWTGQLFLDGHVLPNKDELIHLVANMDFLYLVPELALVG